ncbi:MAG: hypothetical protein AAB386_03960 [Patescibacteria group bacterium]
MLLRALGISILKLTADFLAIMLLFSYVIPSSFGGIVLSIITWCVTFFIAFVFASWAFSKRSPSRRNVLTLIAVWLTVTVGGFAVFGMRFSLQGLWAVVSTELLVQYVLEILAILFAAYRHKSRHVSYKISGEEM